MPTAYVADRISQNIARTPENFLICKDVALARTAEHHPQQYRGSEIGIPYSDEIYDVYRPAAEVFSARALHSAEGKPVCSPHPPAFLSSDNAGWYSKGHVQNVRKGPVLDDGEQSLIGDLVVTDAGLIAQIESGALREISLGYRCTYWPRDDNSYEQRDILINHAAVVPSARAGSEVAIQDASGEAVMDKEVREALDKAISLCNDMIKAKKLRQEARAIQRSSERTEALTRANLGPGELHRRLLQDPTYARYVEDQEAGEEFSANARAAGLKLGERLLEPFRAKCADSAAPVREHQEAEDWADAVNRRGREMRGR